MFGKAKFHAHWSHYLAPGFKGSPFLLLHFRNGISPANFDIIFGPWTIESGHCFVRKYIFIHFYHFTWEIRREEIRLMKKKTQKTNEYYASELILFHKIQIFRTIERTYERNSKRTTNKILISRKYSFGIWNTSHRSLYPSITVCIYQFVLMLMSNNRSTWNSWI